jgi:peptidoglycan/LPS O-acetylase OafA/YrhL
LLIGLLSLLLTWPLAWASERWVERPFSRLMRGKTVVRGVVAAGQPV